MSKVREAAHTVAIVDDYCGQYRALFANVRHFEQFTALRVGLLAATKRESGQRLARVAKADVQALRLCLPPPALAPHAPTAAPASRPRRPLRPHEHLPSGLPNMPEEG